jgi:2-C-methyl-D-erythritol 4-phosphate cytidylyltransferase
VWGIALAAGAGTRFGAPKQFAEVQGVRLVDRVVDVMTSVCDGVVLVLPARTEWHGAGVATVVGGPTRSASVRAGLRAVPARAEIIVVHDPAHPLADVALFRRVIAAVRAGADAAAPAVPLDEPIKRITGERVVQSLPRNDVVVIQTPHAFRADALRAAHSAAPEVSEDTELVEREGGLVVVVPGDARNLHVTAAEHLELVARLAGGEWRASRPRA